VHFWRAERDEMHRDSEPWESQPAQRSEQDRLTSVQIPKDATRLSAFAVLRTAHSRSVHSYGSFPTDVSFAALTRLPVGAFLSIRRRGDRIPTP